MEGQAISNPLHIIRCTRIAHLFYTAVKKAHNRNAGSTLVVFIIVSLFTKAYTLIPHLPYPCGCMIKRLQGVSVDDISLKACQRNHMAGYALILPQGFEHSLHEHLPFPRRAYYHSGTKSSLIYQAHVLT